MSDDISTLHSHDETEDRLRAALRSRSALVTGESLRLPDELPHRRRAPKRWPLLTAAASVVALGLVSVPVVMNLGSGNMTGSGHQPTSTLPATPSEPVHEVDEPPPSCPKGENPCVVQTVEVNGETLELVAANRTDAEGYQNWVLRARGGAEIAHGAIENSDEGELPDFTGRVNPYLWSEPLKCESGGGGDPARCLLDTYDLGDTNDVYGLIRLSSGWVYHATYPTPWGKESIDYRLIGGKPYVVAVQQDGGIGGGDAHWWARVWEWAEGKALGCTPQESRKEDLRGWPDLDTLDAENCGGF